MPDEEKCEAFFRAQKTVVERKHHKGACADWCFAEPITAERLLCANRVLSAGLLFLTLFKLPIHIIIFCTLNSIFY